MELPFYSSVLKSTTLGIVWKLQISFWNKNLWKRPVQLPVFTDFLSSQQHCATDAGLQIRVGVFGIEKIQVHQNAFRM